jgi:hypothetical protein
VTLAHEDSREVLHLKVACDRPTEELRPHLEEALLHIRGIRVECQDTHSLSLGTFQSVPPGSLSGDLPKTRRIVDKRAQT